MQKNDLVPSESLVLSTILELGKADVYELTERINRDTGKNWKFQTVNTLCLRLKAKDLLECFKAGRRVVYTPKITRNRFFESLVQKFFGLSLKRDPSPLISYLTKIEKLNDRDKKTLIELLQRLKDQQ